VRLSAALTLRDTLGASASPALAASDKRRNDAAPLQGLTLLPLT
jgi:hypothetical protein